MKIIAAAINFYPVDSEYPQIACGKRHGDAFEIMYNHGIAYDKKTAVQGFLTDDFRFVDRYEAKKIAVEANQLITPIEETYAALYSEDVW